jgi:Right handed beta helix region
MTPRRRGFALLVFVPLLLAAIRMVLPAAPATEADFYVALDGDDRWSGKLPAPDQQKNDGPFATLERARDAVRSLKGQSSGRRSITVMIRQGTYFLNAPLAFGPDDSGTPDLRIVYEAYPDETPVLSGGRRIAGWTRTGNRWEADVHLDYFEQLWVDGKRRMRPRTTKTGYLYNAGPVYVPQVSEACPPSQPRPNFGGLGGPAARPNSTPSRLPPGFRQRFPGQPAESPAQTGRPSPAPPPPPGQYECFDRFYFHGGDVQPGWHNLDDVEILDFEDWTMSRMRLKSVDSASDVAYLTGWTNRAGRFFGFLPGHRYLVENVREALSQPGEWYLERDTGRLTYLGEPGEDPNRAEVIAPQLGQLVSARNLSYVTFKDLTFSYTNWVVPAEGYRSNEGELRVPAALSFVDSGGIAIDGCVVSHTGGWGIDFRGTGPWSPAEGFNDRVMNSQLTDLGAGGIRIGYEPGLEDTESNVAQHDLVENTVISSGGRMLAEAAGIWIGDAHDNTIRHDDIYDFYNIGINLGHSLNYVGGLTHDNLIELNDLHQLGQGVTDDIGAVHAVTSSTTGNKILNNKMHDITHDPGQGGYGGWAIYFDQGTSNVIAQNNLVYRVSQAGFHQNTGQNNQVTNNIFAFEKMAAVERSNNEEHLSFTFTHNIVYGKESSPLSGFWLCRDRDTFTEIPCASRFLFDHNLYWNPSATGITFEAGRNPLNPEPLLLTQWQARGEDVHSIVADPLFVNPSYPADDFRLRPHSPASRVGFVPFDSRQAGRSPGSRPSPPPLPPAYPLQVADPSRE